MRSLAAGLLRRTPFGSCCRLVGTRGKRCACVAPKGERVVALTDFFALPTADRRRETTIVDDELLLAVELPQLPAGSHSTYLKAMIRKVWAFALCRCCRRFAD